MMSYCAIGIYNGYCEILLRLIISYCVWADAKECACVERELKIIYSESIFLHFKILSNRKFVVAYGWNLKSKFFLAFLIFEYLGFVRFSDTNFSTFSITALHQWQLSQSICQLKLFSCLKSGFTDLTCNTDESGRAVICIKS